MTISRLKKLMKKLGFRSGNDPSYYNAFHDWTVKNQSEFYSAALEDLRFRWMKKPDKILVYDNSDPIWKAKWFVNGEANVYDVCVEEQIRRGRENSIALIWRREDGAGLQLTFREVKEKVEIIASHLKEEGIRQGDKIAVIVPSSQFAYLLFYAIQKIGAIFIPIPTEIMDLALSKRLAMTRPKLIFATKSFIYNHKDIEYTKNLYSVLEKLNAAEKYAPKLIVIDYIENTMSGAAILPPDSIYYHSWIAQPASGLIQTQRLSSEDVTMILFTSGTTGTPKGTMHTYCALIEDIIENAYASGVDAGDRFLWYTSPGWMMFPWLVMGTNGLGATAVLYDGSPSIKGKETMLDLVETLKLTHLGLSPPLIADLIESLKTTKGYKKRLSSLREIMYTSSPLAKNMADKLARFGYPPGGVCGGTDGCFAYASGNPITKREGSTMMPSLGVDVHVAVNINGQWREAKPEELGELTIKSPFPSMNIGLINDDENRTVFRNAYFNYNNSIRNLLGSETHFWIHGDLASFDKKRRLIVHGRADDLLVVHGNKLSPSDVQDAVLSENKEVSDIAPISLSIKDGDGGELLLFAVLKSEFKNASHDSLHLLSDRIKDSVKNRVNRLAKPCAVFFVESIPYTINNKPAFRLIRDAFVGKTVGDTSTIKNKEGLKSFSSIGKAFFEKKTNE